VAPDVRTIEARLRFDLAGRVAEGVARVQLDAGNEDGRIALDLRQQVKRVLLDGRDLGVHSFAPADLGGGRGGEIRVLDVELEAASQHLLEVHYELATPTQREPYRSDGEIEAFISTCGCPT
jgi:hypothetical protein